MCVCGQSFVSERSIDQDLGCVDRFSCKLDDTIQSLQSFGSGNWHLLLRHHLRLIKESCQNATYTM